MCVCAPSIPPVYRANGQETGPGSECSWNWIKSILCSRAGSVTPSASSWFRQCYARTTRSRRPRHADVLAVKSRRLSRGIRIDVSGSDGKSSGLSGGFIANVAGSRASGRISPDGDDTDAAVAALLIPPEIQRGLSHFI